MGSGRYRPALTMPGLTVMDGAVTVYEAMVALLLEAPWLAATAVSLSLLAAFVIKAVAG